MPTDTIFGVVASVKYESSIRRIYHAKQRDHSKKLIHLIGSTKQLGDLGVLLTEVELKAIKKVWPGPVSIEFSCDDTLPYLHKNTYKIAVRLPKSAWLRDFVKETGSIVATSANIAGEENGTNIEQIKRHLAGLDFYIDGPVGKTPSQLVKINESGDIIWLDR